MNVGIIDLGTNSARLFVYRITLDVPAKKIFRKKVMVRLGDELFQDGRLQEDAKERTLAAFANFRELFDLLEVSTYRAVATSALRTASDGEEFAAIIQQTCGISLDIISGQEEAHLIAAGMLAHLPNDTLPIVLVDIGGGSTEVSLVAKREVLLSESLMIGAARCQQKILKQSPPDQPDVEALRNEVRAALLAQFPKTELASLNARHAIRCMGSSGSVRALARLGSRNTGSEREFSAKYLGRLIEELSVLSREEIAALPNIEPRRADLILSAAIILEEILRFFSCEHVQATSHALKDGILAELLRTQLAEQSGLK